MRTIVIDKSARTITHMTDGYGIPLTYRHGHTVRIVETNLRRQGYKHQRIGNQHVYVEAIAVIEAAKERVA